MLFVFELAGFVGTLFSDPSLLLDRDLTFLLAIVVTDYAFCRVIVPVADVIGSCRNLLRTLLIINKQCFSVRSQSFRVLGVEPTVISGGVFPLLSLEFQGIIEEILSFE